MPSRPPRPSPPTARSCASLVQQAANLEATWCGLGLHVMETGAGFMLPPGFDLLPAGTQLSLHQTLAESRTDVEKMASDAVGAAEDLAVAIGAAIVALEDFQLIEVGAAAGDVAGREVRSTTPSRIPPDRSGDSALTLAGRHRGKYAEDDSSEMRVAARPRSTGQGALAKRARSRAATCGPMAGDARTLRRSSKAAERAGVDYRRGCGRRGIQVLEDSDVRRDSGAVSKASRGISPRRDGRFPPVVAMVSRRRDRRRRLALRS